MRTILIGLVVLAVAVGGWAAAQESAPAGKKLRVHLISGSAEYKSDESLAKLQSWLEALPAEPGRPGVICTRSFAKDKGNELPNLEALDQADVMVVFTRRITLPADQLARIKKWCADGKPVVGIRTASHGFQNWLAFDKEVLGGNYQGHYEKDELAQVMNLESDKTHPVLVGVDAFTTQGKLYKNPGVGAPAVTVLLHGATAAQREPVLWVRAQGAGHGRVVYTSLGVPEDFANEQFQRMLVNGVRWAGGR